MSGKLAKVHAYVVDEFRHISTHRSLVEKNSQSLRIFQRVVSRMRLVAECPRVHFALHRLWIPSRFLDLYPRFDDEDLLESGCLLLPKKTV